MRKLALSAMVIGAAAAIMIPAIAPANARAVKKHQRHWTRHYGQPWYGYPAQPMVRPTYQSGDVCPGIGRSFDCKIWPPPIEDDPDRKTSKF
jgi:hypothetical protein